MSDTVTARPVLRCSGCGAELATAWVHGVCAGCLWGTISDTAPEHPESSASALKLNLPGLEITAHLASGGMGAVYRALEKQTRRPVAVKMLLPHLRDLPDMKERFHTEARAMAGLDHPNIVPVYHVGEYEGLPYFIMKLMRGGTLAVRAPEMAGRWREMASLMAQLAAAVHHAHQRGVLHRDLKPSNILFDEAGQPCVSDFGIVKFMDDDSGLTSSVQMLGTPHYLAPEVAAANSRHATVASDVWSLGAIFYECLAGRRAFDAAGIPSLLRLICEVDAAPVPDRIGLPGGRVPRDLDVICRKCLMRGPAQRYGSAQELADDLNRWLEGRPIAARPASRWEKWGAWVRRNPVPATLAALLVMALAAGGYFLVRARSETLERLRISLTAHARAALRSAQPGTRSVALESLREAARLKPSAEVRDIFITALALPDFAESTRVPWTTGPPALSPDLKWSAMVEDDRVVLRSTGQPDEVVPSPDGGNPERVGPFTPDGAGLLIHSAETTGLWDRREQEWRARWQSAHDVQFSPDGRWACCGREKGNMELRPLGDGEFEPLRWQHGVNRCRVLGFSPDSRWLAVTETGTPELAVYEVPSGRRAWTFTHPEPATVRSGAWRPDGKALAAGTENFKIYIWRLGENVLPPQLIGHAGNVFSMAWSPDGRYLLSAALDDPTRIWDALTCQPVTTLPWVGRRVAWSADGKLLAADDETERVTVLCQAGPPEVCQEITVPHPDLDERATAGAWGTVFSPDNRWLLACDTGGIFVFDPLTGSLLKSVATGYAWALAFPDAGTLIGGTRDGVRRWSLGGPHHAPEIAEQAPLLDGDTNMLTAPDGTGIIAVARGHEVLLFEDSTANPRVLTGPEKCDTIALSPDKRFVACGHLETGGVSVWDLSRDGPPVALPAAGSGAALAWVNNGSLLIIGDEAGVRACTAGAWQQVWSIPRTGHTPRPSVLAERAGIVAAVIEQGEITLLDPATGRVLTHLIHPRPRDIRWIALNNDATRLAAMTLGHIIQSWDLKKLRAELQREGLDWK